MSPDGSAKVTGTKQLSEKFRANMWKSGQSGNTHGLGVRRYKISELAREYTLTSLGTLAEICGNPRAKNSDRIKAAEALLAYGYGKPSGQLNVSFGQGDDEQPGKTPDQLAQERFAGVLERAAEKAHRAIPSAQPLVPAPTTEVLPVESSARELEPVEISVEAQAPAQVLTPEEGAALDAARESVAQAQADADKPKYIPNDNFKAKAAAAIVGSAIAQVLSEE